MATGKRSEIVRSVGRSLGNRSVLAACQSTYCVESARAHNPRSSSSERKLGILLFAVAIDPLFVTVHIADRDHANQRGPQRNRGKQKPARPSPAQRVVALFLRRVASVASRDQWLVEEDVFRFLGRYAMPLPILGGVSLVLIESRTFGKWVGHALHRYTLKVYTYQGVREPSAWRSVGYQSEVHVSSIVLVIS